MLMQPLGNSEINGLQCVFEDVAFSLYKPEQAQAYVDCMGYNSVNCTFVD